MWFLNQVQYAHLSFFFLALVLVLVPGGPFANTIITMDMQFNPSKQKLCLVSFLFS